MASPPPQPNPKAVDSAAVDDSVQELEPNAAPSTVGPPSLVRASRLLAGAGVFALLGAGLLTAWHEFRVYHTNATLVSLNEQYQTVKQQVRFSSKKHSYRATGPYGYGKGAMMTSQTITIRGPWEEQKRLRQLVIDTESAVIGVRGVRDWSLQIVLTMWLPTGIALLTIGGLAELVYRQRRQSAPTVEAA